MVVGGLVAALAFVLSAIVQFQINTTLPDTPMDGRAFVSTINAFDNCTLKVCAANGNGAENCRILEPNQTLTNTNRKKPEMFELDAGQQKWRIEGTGGGECGDRSFEGEVGQGISAGSTYWMMVSRMGVLFGETDTQKPTGAMGEFKVGITLALEDIEYGGNLALCRWRSENDEGTAICDPRRTADFVGWQVEDGDLMSKSAFEMPNDGRKSAHNATIYGYKTVRSGRWKLFLMKERPKAIGQETMSKEQLNLTETGIVLEVGTQGGIYMVALTGSLSAVEKRIFHAVPDNSVSILWQIPQIMMITAAEVLFSITGYEFAYSQAPPSMKSLVQALWLMTTAIGDLIILLITLIAFPNEAIEFLFYAAGMVVVITILALLAIFYYEYNNYTTDTDTTRKFEEKNNEKKQPFKGGGGRKRSGRRIQIYGTTEEKSGTKKTEEKAEKII